MKTKTLLVALGAVIGLELGLESIGSVEKDCEVYQGYTNIDPDIGTQYIFDPKDAYERPSFPEYIMEGSPSLADSLKIGERYCFELKEPLAPWAAARIKSIDLGNRIN